MPYLSLKPNHKGGANLLPGDQVEAAVELFARRRRCSPFCQVVAIKYNNFLTLAGIPAAAFAYKLGN